MRGNLYDRNRFNVDVSPQLIFANTYTKASDTASGQPAGREFASLLLGVPADLMGRTASFAERDYYFALYVQDDWKVSRKLNVNLGLRWRRETSISERYTTKALDTSNRGPVTAFSAAPWERPTAIPGSAAILAVCLEAGVLKHRLIILLPMR